MDSGNGNLKLEWGGHSQRRRTKTVARINSNEAKLLHIQKGFAFLSLSQLHFQASYAPSKATFQKQKIQENRQMKRDVRILINTLHSSSPRRKCNCRMNGHLGVFATELRAKSKFVHGRLEVKLSECIIHGQTLTEEIASAFNCQRDRAHPQHKIKQHWTKLGEQVASHEDILPPSACLTKQQKTFQQTLKKWPLHCDLSRPAMNLQNHKLASIY